MKDWVDEKLLGEVYCKRCRKPGFLLAEIEKSSSNLRIDFLLQHKDGKTHFLGRKTLKSVSTINKRE